MFLIYGNFMEILDENMRESNYKLLPFKRNQLIFLSTYNIIYYYRYFMSF